VLKNNVWILNKHSQETNIPNIEHGKVNLQMKEHAYVHKRVDQI